MENAPDYAPLHIEDVTDTVQSHTPAQGERTLQRTGNNLYSSRQIAERYPDIHVKEVTIRTRWYVWLERVAPELLLKKGHLYTDLAAELFDDFAQRVKRDRMDSKAWVEDAKARFSHEWGSVGVIDGEFMPDEVGNALALLQTQGSSLQTQLAAEMADIEAFVEQLGDVEDDFSQAELDMFRAQGAMRGVRRFKVEVQAELGTYNLLKKKRMQDNTGEGQP
ncbi:hypothetical protein H6F75_26155 [Nodosilinea sp. FACHB-131]|uniref:hypothetical protein n=1 Tax=Cyanophyceae TaxID=3028117 RepID=UPI001686856D|nr:hypothetical protein [Nodosilinea sp. FACHB-131]MBD1876972.1 hypothetical protein [Nodosilinea sp. FACHB-131]